MGRNEIPDHVTVLTQLAAARPFIDMSRVGVWGGSFGGYFAIRAMLMAPEVYQVGVAMAPVADLKEPFIKLWMGRPEDNPEGYDYASNLLNADRLMGNLLIIHGTADTNAKLAETMRMIDALERENKPYDLVLIPDGTHAAQSSFYAINAVKRYLVEHLKP
jgi:dipeptidyl aminopeptidase/acylaminoacyl peptidase